MIHMDPEDRKVLGDFVASVKKRFGPGANQAEISVTVCGPKRCTHPPEAQHGSECLDCGMEFS